MIPHYFTFLAPNPPIPRVNSPPFPPCSSLPTPLPPPPPPPL